MMPDANTGGSARRRLSKPARREQLLDTALAIIRAQGADALTFGTLADAAAVSRAIVYEHFEARPGLLVALYRRIDEQQATALADALRQAPPRLQDVARVMGTAYFECTVGPEWHAVSAALKGSVEMEAVQQELLDRYVGIMAGALAPFSDLPPDDLRLHCIGLLGAAEAIARGLPHGRVDGPRAVAALARLIAAGIEA